MQKRYSINCFYPPNIAVIEGCKLGGTVDIQLNNKPKADFFESIIGACFVDGGKNLKQSMKLCQFFLYRTGLLNSFSKYNWKPIIKNNEKGFHSRAVKHICQQLNHTYTNQSNLNSVLDIIASEKDIKKQKDYQRLEFLGDAVVDVITINYFFNTFKNANPKELTQFKHMSVQNQEFADLLIKLELIDDIPFHSSEAAGCKQYITKRKNGSSSIDEPAPKYIADLFEVLVGAIHIDNHYYFKKTNYELSQLLIDHIFKHNSLNQTVVKFEVINECLNNIVMVGRKYVHLNGFINNPKAVYRLENVSNKGTSCCIYVQFRENELIPLTEFTEIGKNKKIAKRKVAQKIVDCYNDIGEEKFGTKLIQRITNFKNKTYTLDYWRN